MSGPNPRRVLLKRMRIAAAALLVATAALTATSVSSAKSSHATARTATTLKIGLVTDIGGLNDRSFNHLAYLGVTQAQKKLGVQ